MPSFVEDGALRSVVGVVNDIGDANPLCRFLVEGRDQVHGINIGELLEGLDGKRVEVSVRVLGDEE